MPEVNAAPVLVLDTNVVIDWLVFNDPYMNPLRRAVAQGRVVVMTAAPAMAELQRVLAYPQLKLEPGRQATIFAHYVAATSPALLPDGFAATNLLLPPKFPLCRDPDDQPFLALAWHTRATMLASRDKALLKLRKRAAKFGVTIVDVQQLIGAM